MRTQTPRELAGAPSDARMKIWSAIRISRRGFRVRDLLVLTGARRKAIEKFLRPLVAAGYLAAEGAGPARAYRLIRDTGPMPPRVSERRGVVFDANIRIAELREHHARLIRDIRAVEDEIGRLGAFVEKWQAAAACGEDAR